MPVRNGGWMFDRTAQLARGRRSWPVSIHNLEQVAAFQSHEKRRRVPPRHIPFKNSRRSPGGKRRAEMLRRFLSGLLAASAPPGRKVPIPARQMDPAVGWLRQNK